MFAQSIRQWDVVSGMCLRAARVSEVHPVMALHWDQVSSSSLVHCVAVTKVKILLLAHLFMFLVWYRDI